MGITKRREEVAERDELLLYLARFLPKGEQDSPAAVARFLLDLKERRFGGLSVHIPDPARRNRFEAWVSLGTQASLAKAAQRAFRGRQASAGREEARKSLPAPLLWPLGLEQRKKLEPRLKESIFDPKRGEPGRMFLRSVADARIYRVEVRIWGERLGSWLSLAPGEIVEINWRSNPKVLRAATYGGWREDILAFESNSESVEMAKSMGGNGSQIPEVRELWRKFAAFAEHQLNEVRRVLPPDLNVWRHRVTAYPFEATFTDASGTMEGRVSGNLHHSMERMWFKFIEALGFEQEID